MNVAVPSMPRIDRGGEPGLSRLVIEVDEHREGVGYPRRPGREPARQRDGRDRCHHRDRRRPVAPRIEASDRHLARDAGEPDDERDLGRRAR